MTVTLSDTGGQPVEEYTVSYDLCNWIWDMSTVNNYGFAPAPSQQELLPSIIKTDIALIAALALL